MKCVVLMIVYNKIQYDARVIRAAEALADIGLTIKVISCNSDKLYHNSKFESIVFSSEKSGKLILFDFLLQCWHYLKQNKNNIDLLYLHDYYMPILGGFWSRRIKKEWVYDAHELLFSRKNAKVGFRSKFFIYFEKKYIKLASLVITANEERRRIMSRIYKLTNSISILNIANVHEKYIDNENKENIIVYQGVISFDRGVDFYVKGQKHLLNNYKLKLVGGGSNLEQFKQYVRDEKLSDDVIFTGQLDQKQLYEESMHAKIGIVTYSMSTLNNYYCSPNKIFEYAKMRLPMIVTPQPFLVEIIKKYHIGEILTSRDISLYVSLVKKINDNYDYYTEGMSQFLKDYSYEKEMKKLQKGILDIIYTLSE